MVIGQRSSDIDELIVGWTLHIQPGYSNAELIVTFKGDQIFTERSTRERERFTHRLRERNGRRERE